MLHSGGVIDFCGANSSSESRFTAYVERLAAALGHTDRAAPFRAYCTGLMLPGERKSVEPMAARVAPGRVGAHQSLHHFVAKVAWDDRAVLEAVHDLVLPALLERGPLRFWIIDDTGMPKKGHHSVGVARQYCGQIGKQDNCQVAVSLLLATDHASLPIAVRLYLPETWSNDPIRRAKAGIPDAIAFQTKPAIALDQIRAAVVAGLPPGVVLMDAGYGTDADLRTGIGALGLIYVAGIQSSTSLWPPGVTPLPPKPWSGTGRPPKLLRRGPGHEPVAAKALAQGLALAAWHTVTWHERPAHLPLCCRPGPSSPSRQRAGRTACGGMAAGQVTR